LNFVANTGYKNGYQPDLNQLRFNYLIGANLAIPIYSGGKIDQQVQIAKSTARLNELTMETLRNNYKRDIQQTLADINSNQERLRNIESQITQAKETSRLAASRFKNGTGTHLELTTAITNIQRAELTKLQYQYQLCLSNIELARLTGVKYW
jgi:outer membrane protein TolC